MVNWKLFPSKSISLLSLKFENFQQSCAVLVKCFGTLDIWRTFLTVVIFSITQFIFILKTFSSHSRKQTSSLNPVFQGWFLRVFILFALLLGVTSITLIVTIHNLNSRLWSTISIFHTTSLTFAIYNYLVTPSLLFLRCVGIISFSCR